MKTTVNRYDFARAFEQMGRKDNFSHAAPFGYVPSDFCRTLERSLADANERHMFAVLCIGHWDLHYHSLLSAVRSLLVTRRKLTDAQSAVLTSVLDELAEKAQSKPPVWPVSDKGQHALLSSASDKSDNKGGAKNIL